MLQTQSSRDAGIALPLHKMNHQHQSSDELHPLGQREVEIEGALHEYRDYLFYLLSVHCRILASYIGKRKNEL